MSTTENIDHLISLLTAKRDGKKIERHCDKCGPDYRCAVCRGWEDFEILTLAFHPDHYRIAPEPAPKGKVCGWCKNTLWPKPTPTYRPYNNLDEFPFNCKVRKKLTPWQFFTPIWGDSTGIECPILGPLTWKKLFDDCEITINGRDWTPAGVEEGK